MKLGDHIRHSYKVKKTSNIIFSFRLSIDEDSNSSMLYYSGKFEHDIFDRSMKDICYFSIRYGVFKDYK